MSLTDKQIERQDLVDNAIHAMLREVMAYQNPNRDLGWDIRVISDIREVIQKEYCRELGDSMEFYPWDDEELWEDDDSQWDDEVSEFLWGSGDLDNH